MKDFFILLFSKFYFWVPLIVCLYTFQSFLSVKNNIHGGKWTWIYFAVSLLTPWILISKYSKNIVFDAMIFDTFLVLSYSLGLLYFTNSFSKLSLYQYVGCVMIFFGIFLFKKGI